MTSAAQRLGFCAVIVSLLGGQILNPDNLRYVNIMYVM